MELTEPRVFIENRTFDEILPGETASLTRTLSREDIELFAVMSGDVNPAHVDEEFAHSDMFHQIIAHGMWGASLISALLGTRLPGPGAIYLEQTLRFRHPAMIGDTITVSVTAAEKEPGRKRVTFDCRCVNQRGEAVIDGTAKVIAPTEKIRRPRAALPTVRMYEHGVLFRELAGKARTLEPIRVAVAHPVDRDSLLGAIQAAQAGLIIPVLVGPQDRIGSVAAANSLDITGLQLVATEHSHGAAAAAVALARSGQVDAVLKGGLPTDEVMRPALAPGTGLATDRRMSHVFVMEVPSYPRLLFITDAALNAEPGLTLKRDIVQNAIDLARAVGVPVPKVAVLSAVETVNPALRSSLDAAALAKMAERGQILGGVVDGPLAFDDAVSPAAMRVNGIASPVAGQADILIVPDLESGNMLVKQLDSLGDSQAAGIVLGARVPILLTGRASQSEQMAACAIAVLMLRAPRPGKPAQDQDPADRVSGRPQPPRDTDPGPGELPATQKPAAPRVATSAATIDDPPARSGLRHSLGRSAPAAVHRARVRQLTRGGLLDEVTQGLDPQARRATWELIGEIRHGGTTVVLVTHFMDEAEHLCDRVAVIDRGRVVAFDTPQRCCPRACATSAACCH